VRTKEELKMKAILCTILIGLSLIGSAAAANLELTGFNTDYSKWLEFSLINLGDKTPAFASGWGQATASATFDPEVYGTEGLKPYTVADVVFNDPNGAKVINLPRDPDATMNFTVVSTSALGATTLKSADIRAGTQAFDSYASAAGVAFTDVAATRNAWTDAAFDIKTDVDPISSTSNVIGAATAIADNIHIPYNPT